MKHIYDMAVIGAGPSGASVAFHLVKKGIKTILNEKEKLLPEIRIGVRLAELFYRQKTFRNLLLRKYGQRTTNLTDIFMGNRSFPVNFMEKIKEKIGVLIFLALINAPYFPK